MDLAWIESEGGPVIRGGIAEAPVGWVTNSDYDNACEVDTGAVPFGVPSAPSLAFAINDIPAPTTYLEEFRALVQWIAAPSDDRLVEVVRGGIDFVKEWEDGPVVQVNGRLALFDAARPGAQAVADELLLVDVEPGGYRLRTADIEPDTGTCARVHRLDRLIE
jgi:hypothetical protein